MKTMKKTLAWCLAFLLVFSTAFLCGTPEASAASEGSWTIFLYLCGSDLESDCGYGTEDMGEILNANYSDDVTVVIETGGAASWDNDSVNAEEIQRYVKTGDGIYCVDIQPAADMGEAGTLSSFLKWGTANYPADHMGLVFWNHGGGSITGVCFDERNDYNSLSLTDISEALSSAGAEFEFIGFDACLMATLETANILAPYANYMYASEETEPGGGWNYTAILNYLAENPSADGKELGKEQCESYYEGCMEEEEDPSITFSIIDLSRIGDLVDALDAASKELYDSGDFAPIVRGILNADNFGGNNKTEGYTNMVDLGDMLRNISDYAPSASNALSALGNAVIYCRNASMHKNAAGLSIYYPLSIQGSTELSVFREICPSTYYLALVDMAAAGADISAGGTESSGFAGIEESSSLEVSDAYLDENGIYTVELSSMDEFAYASCSLYADFGDEGIVYLGEDDDVYIDYDNNIIQDNFDGCWLTLYDEGFTLPVELVAQYETTSLYAVEVLLNGESTNLQVVYDWEEDEFYVLGTWDGINSESGMAARGGEPLNDGDVLNIVYYYADSNDEWDYFISDDIVVDGELYLAYDYLPEADYYYAINVYDIYGNCYELDYTVFNVDENGEVSFYEDW